MRKISLAFLMFHWLTAVTAQHYSKAVNEQIARVETNLSGGLVIDGKPFTLAERMKHFNVAGLTVAVIDNYQIVWAKGYGYADKKENRKVTINTMFEPGSISKSLNAVGILQLVQEGKLDLYQDINQYLVNWKFPYDTVSHGKKITTAQLLSHTAGLGVHGFPGYHRDSAIASVTDILDGRVPSNTEDVRSLTEPGGEPRYSGGGILITQQMLTDLTKQRYEQYMYEHVLRPLGMTNSSYNQPPSVAQSKNLATGYKSNGDEVPGKYFVYPEKAAAGLWTTPTDICKYILEMQQAYQGKTSKLLNQEMVKLHVTPYKYDVALGTYIQNRNGEKYFVHSASNEGFTGYFLGGLTNGKGVALFVNSEDGYVLLELLNSIALVYNWAGSLPYFRVSIITMGKPFSIFATKDGLASNNATHIYEDRAGNIWFGASRYDGKSFRNFTTKDGFPSNSIRLLLEDKTGKLWFGAQLENMFVYDGKTFTVLKNKDGTAFKNVWSIIEDKKGNIWTTGAVNPNGKVWALSRYDAKSLYNKMPKVTEIKSGAIMAFLGILEANDGSIWFGSGGVHRYDGKTITDFKSAAGQQ